MSDRTSKNGPEEDRLLELLRKQSDPEASEAFLAQLQRGFREGTLQSPFESESPTPWSRIRSAFASIRGPLLPLAAGAVVIAILIWANAGRSFDNFSAAGNGEAIIGGRSISLADRAAIGAALRPGATVELRGDMTAMLNLFYQDDYALQIIPGTRVTIPRGLPRWLRRGAGFEVLAGEARVVTGPGFPGARMSVKTSQASVEVVGTTFAVIAGADSTCVCVLDGTAHLGMGTAPAMSVPPMMRATVRMPSGTATMEPIRPMEERKLSELRASAMPMLESR